MNFSRWVIGVSSCAPGAPLNFAAKASPAIGPMLGFEALTLAPIDRRLVDRALLTPEEIAQMDAYHARVLAVIGAARCNVLISGGTGSGKTTLLNCLAGRLAPEAGAITYDSAAYGPVDVHGLSEARRWLLSRTEWGFVNQDARDGLRMGVSAGANIGERLMAVGWDHYGRIRDTASSSLRTG